jgi:hypothetical protein
MLTNAEPLGQETLTKSIRPIRFRLFLSLLYRNTWSI